MGVLCPVCENNVENGPKNEWVYAKYVVNRFLCNNCNESFNVYYSEDSREAYTIPKRARH
jgi:transposase-like protein